MRTYMCAHVHMYMYAHIYTVCVQGVHKLDSSQKGSHSAGRGAATEGSLPTFPCLIFFNSISITSVELGGMRPATPYHAQKKAINELKRCTACNLMLLHFYLCSFLSASSVPVFFLCTFSSPPHP